MPHQQRPNITNHWLPRTQHKPSITQNDKVRWAVEKERFKNPTVQDLTRANLRVCCKKVTFFWRLWDVTVRLSKKREQNTHDECHSVLWIRHCLNHSILCELKIINKILE